MRTLVAVALLAATMGSPALACPPPIPGQTEAERLRPAFDRTTDIVYGVVTKGAKEGRLARFRVIHVYKGDLAPGAVISGVPTYGFDPPPCLGMTHPTPPPAVGIGEYGVVAFNDRTPALNFVNSWTLDLMFKEGWIKSAWAR